jgi:hypothetical protein
MTSVIQWFLFGMFVWGCCIVMNALARRFAPEMMTCDGHSPEMQDELDGHHQRRARRRSGATPPDPRDIEIIELKQRVATLEAIVTDRKFQWEQEFNARD